jgi:fatty acid desaturase
MHPADAAVVEESGELESKPARFELPLAALAELKKPSLTRFTLAITADWVAVVAAFVLARRVDHVAAYVVATWFIGTRQHAIGVMGHEGTHRRLGSRTPRLDEALTQLFCMWPLLSDMHAYGDFHLSHHRNLNTVRDPEMKYRASGAPGWDVPRSQARFATQIVADLLGFGALEILRVMRFTVPATRQRAVGPALLTAAFVGACLWTGQVWVLVMWYAALFTGFAAVWRLRCWLEHMGSDDTHRVHIPFLLAWLFAPHGIWLHWEHHRFPGVPFYNLAVARALTLQAAPVISLGELLRYYDGCKPVKSGTATKNAGRPLLVAS